MPSYVPPHLRQGTQNGAKLLAIAKPPTSEDLLSIRDIEHYFWPSEKQDAAEQSDKGQHLPTSKGKTLHDSEDTPGRLRYIFLFHDANPRWDSDNIVFSKSNLKLLDGVQVKTSIDENDTSPGEEDAADSAAHPDAAKQAIAVFRQVGTRNERSRSFKWEGWFRIVLLDVLEPKSDELVRMLEQKFRRTDTKGRVVQAERSGAKWQQSLGMKWAVMKFARGEEAERELGKPRVERLPDQPLGPGRSVNEMLAELRLGKGA